MHYITHIALYDTLQLFINHTHCTILHVKTFYRST
uniref:Uncharacterized protein n=1 Tax=Arundo donax TaxID=35708 RepID=A0A0A8ZTR1_ARUDO